MTPILRRGSLRHLWQHPWQFGLAILGIALGVSVAVAIDLANDSARRAFTLASEAITGHATHQIVGGPGGVPEMVYPTLRLALGMRRVAPVVEGDVGAPDHPGRTFHLLGVDPLAEAPFRPYLIGAGRDDTPAEHGPMATLASLLARPGAVLVPRAVGAQLGLALGDGLVIRVAGVRRSVWVAAWIEPRDELSSRALEHLLVTDIASAQELLGAPGRLSRIDLILPEGLAGAAARERIARSLPPGVEIVGAGARADAAGRLTRAFSLNLTALSLLALLVGTFLIYNTMTFSVVQRRPLIGMLRALGVTRREVFGLVMAEAVLVAALGTAAGLVLGVELARLLLRFVTQTINDLYFVLSVREVSVTPAVLAKGAALGVGATLLATLFPALEATGAAPRAALSRSGLEAGARRAARRAATLGAVMLAAGAGLMVWPGAGVGAGFVALFGLVVGSALLAPAAAMKLVEPLHGWAGRALGPLTRMAIRGIGAALSRTGVAIAALMVAVSATIGVGIMIGSFREAVARWLEDTLRADAYVSAPSLIGNRPDATLEPALIARLVATPGVAGASTTRAAVAPSAEGPVNVVALGLAAGRRPGFRFLQGQPDTVWAAFDAGAVLVSEPFAYRRGLRSGDTLSLRTDRGETTLRVAGVFSDYGSTAGVVMIARSTYERLWDDRAVSGLALEAAPGITAGALVDALRARAAGGPDVLIRSNRSLREASLVIFDRTFAITAVLRLIIVGVAFIGVLSALMALQLERGREIAVLRALGCTPRQVWGMITAQTGLMGLVAGLFAVPVGIGLALVLVRVINRRSFGWTMPLDLSPAVLLEGLGLALTAALLAGIVPARRMARASPAEALRDE